MRIVDDIVLSWMKFCDEFLVILMLLDERYIILCIITREKESTKLTMPILDPLKYLMPLNTMLEGP